jgi:2',3'-cyclic-nucleotide 2'-phosphodiesterase (5'-nucleotidase family)
MLLAVVACLAAPLLSGRPSDAAPGAGTKKASSGAAPSVSVSEMPGSRASGGPAGGPSSSSSSSSLSLVAPSGSAPAGGFDVLTMVRTHLDASPRAIGTCDPAQREKGVARIGFAHINDLQARYSDVLAGRSRYSYIAGVLNQLKAAQPTLVLDAGDDYEKGALAELRSSGETTRQMVQALPIDVRTIGNHDFAYGATAVLRDVRLSKHPVLAANVKHTGLPASEQPFRPYARFDVGCVRVGVIGLVTQNFGADDRPTSAPYDGVFVQDDHYQAILEREATAHRAEVDVLIALTHLGYADDVALAHRGGRLVDLIVGAHTEDLINEPQSVHHRDNSFTYVLQAGHFGETLGRGELVVKLGESRKIAIEKYKIVEVDESLPHADDVADLAKRLEEAAVPGVHARIGRLSTHLKQAKAISALVWRATAATWNADAMVVGHDLFWSGLPKGDVTLQRLYDAVLVQRQPAGTSGLSSIWIAELSGSEMLALARVFRPGGAYDWFGPKEKFDPAKRYRLALDKRAATYPKVLFGAESKAVHPTFMGEMIDALEAYARARTAKGQSLD